MICLLDFENTSPVSSTIQRSCWENLFLLHPLYVTFFFCLFVLFPLGKVLGSSHHLSSLKFHSNVTLCKFSFIYYIWLAPSFWKLMSFCYGKFHFIVLLVISSPVITFQAFVEIQLWSRTSRTDLFFHIFCCFQGLTFYLLSVQFHQLLPSILWIF